MSDRIEELLRTGGGDGAGEAVERFLAKAEDGQLLDVAYARAESPFGDLLVAATPRGLVRVGFLHTMDEDAAAFNIEQDPIVSAAQPVVTVEIRQPLDVSTQPMFEPRNLSHNLRGEPFRNATQISKGEFRVNNFHFAH